jgi:hypothetical protein
VAASEPFDVEDTSVATIEALIANLTETVDEDDLFYREAELDALFTLFDMALSRAVRDGGAHSAEAAERRVRRDTVHRAHDLAAAGDTKRAATELVALVDTIDRARDTVPGRPGE